MIEGRVIIKVFSDTLHPDKIESYLNVPPTKKWRKGDKKIGVMAHKENGWSFEVCNKDVYDLDESCAQVLDSLSMQIPSFQKLLEAECTIECTIVIYSEDAHIGFQLSPEFVYFLNQIQAVVDVNIYPHDA